VRRPHPAQIATVLTVVALDQAVKAVVRQGLDLFDTIVVVPGFFSLTRVHNTGIAYGLFDTVQFPYKAAVVALVQAAALVGLAAYAASLEPLRRFARAGLLLVIGGAIGNLIDRVTAGYVLDFFDFYWGGWHFWAFNIADASITIGVALMILDLRGAERDHRVS
jgi:signal peptidase II